MAYALRNRSGTRSDPLVLEESDGRNQTEVELEVSDTPSACRPRPSREAVLAMLADAFPGRLEQVQDLLMLLGDGSEPVPPVLVTGGAATGKTSVVRKCLESMGSRYAYVDCRSSHKPRLLFESALNQLLRHTRARGGGYGSARRCDKIADFIAMLPEVCTPSGRHCTGAPDFEACDSPAAPPTPPTTPPTPATSAPPKERVRQGGPSKKRGRGEEVEEALHPETVYLVFDNVELLRDWSSGGSLLPSLLYLPELSGVHQLGVVFISKVGWDSIGSSSCPREPLTVLFPEYTDDELCQILSKRQPLRPLYASFVRMTTPLFSRAFQRVTELGEALDPLFSRFDGPSTCAPVLASRQEESRRLYQRALPHIRGALSRPGALQSLEELDCNRSMQGAPMDCNLSLNSKYMIIAAYIASRNPATLDSALFEAGPTATKKRRNAHQSRDKREAEVHELHMSGPMTFPLERLLAIYQSIVETEGHAGISVADPSLEQHRVVLSSAVLLQLSGLVNVNLIQRVGGHVLDGGDRFMCLARSDFVEKLAQETRFPLSRFLLFG